jgi:hypothetical protein
MESRLLNAIDAAVERALPAGWPRVPCHRLPVCGSVRVRHAFRREAGTGPASCLAIAAVPPFGAKPWALARQLVALVDHVLARGASLLLLYDEASDPEGWIHDHVDCPHPRLLSLGCVWDDDGSCVVEPTAGGVEPLADTIFDLWRGALFYVGPDEGAQTVGIEIMEGGCWHCHAALGIVTGLVFPDREVGDWSAPDWAYFGQLLELAEIPDSAIPALSAAVDEYRAAGRTSLTVIRWRYSKAVRSSYWAAECTVCGAFQGAFPMREDRTWLLKDLESRLSGDLSYLPLTLEVSREVLRSLGSGFEFSEHARPLGWCRADTLDLAGLRELGLIAAAHTVAEPCAPSLPPNPPDTQHPPEPRHPAHIGTSAAAASGESSSAPTGGSPPSDQPGVEEVAARASLGERSTAGHLTRLGQILLPWRGRFRRF